MLVFKKAFEKQLSRGVLKNFRSSRPEVSAKKVLLEISQNSQESACARVSFLKKWQDSGLNFVKKQTLAQLFSCELCEMSKNTILHRTPLVAASEIQQNSLENTCARVSFLIKMQACEFPEISKNTLFYRTLPVAAFGIFFTLHLYWLNLK